MGILEEGIVTVDWVSSEAISDNRRPTPGSWITAILLAAVIRRQQPICSQFAPFFVGLRLIIPSRLSPARHITPTSRTRRDCGECTPSQLANAMLSSSLIYRFLDFETEGSTHKSNTIASSGRGSPSLQLNGRTT